LDAGSKHSRAGGRGALAFSRLDPQKFVHGVAIIVVAFEALKRGV
jgi:hypothetical protein